MNEEMYLREYDSKLFDAPLFSVDAVLFTYYEGQLKALLVERSNHPDQGKWGLPGGFVNISEDETLEDTVIRKLREKTGVKPPYIEQLYAVGNNSRDKRGWSVTVCFTALIAHQETQAHIDSVSDAKWVDIDGLANMDLAFDHKQIINVARERLKQKALYSIVPAYTLPETFTLSDLQQVHEALLGKALQKKSFRRRIEQADLIIDTGEKLADIGRPATLYRLKPQANRHTFIRNLEI